MSLLSFFLSTSDRLIITQAQAHPHPNNVSTTQWYCEFFILRLHGQQLLKKNLAEQVAAGKHLKNIELWQSRIVWQPLHHLALCFTLLSAPSPFPLFPFPLCHFNRSN